MAIEIRQGLKQQQNLSPQLQQAIKVLTLAKTELEEFISEELKDNPFLEEMTQENEDSAQNIEAQSTEGLALIENVLGEQGDERGIDDLLSRFSESLTSVDERIQRESEQNDEQPLYELIQTQSKDLHDFLEEQIMLMHLTPYEIECCLKLLNYIDDNGFLTTDIHELALADDAHIDDYKYALSVIQKCEPYGVGAKDVQESFIIQLSFVEKKPRYVELIIRDYWKDFVKIDVAKIAKTLKAEPSDIKVAFQFIKDNLDPHPARQFGVAQNISASPDVFVFKRDDQWVVSLNEEGLPRIKLSRKYQDLVHELENEQKQKDTKNYLQNKHKNAAWILRALAERNRTIIRVTELIVDTQKEFFELGIEHLKPLTLKKIADDLGLHESTISRSTSNKFLHSPRGLFELKYFFNAGLESDDGSSLANETIKQWVAEFIKAENPLKPYSDQDISEKIHQEKGLTVARRTVAKYREGLGIASSSKRVKRF